jgi:hypothetical protein
MPPDVSEGEAPGAREGDPATPSRLPFDQKATSYDSSGTATWSNSRSAQSGQKGRSEPTPSLK